MVSLVSARPKSTICSALKHYRFRQFLSASVGRNSLRTYIKRTKVGLILIKFQSSWGTANRAWESIIYILTGITLIWWPYSCHKNIFQNKCHLHWYTFTTKYHVVVEKYCWKKNIIWLYYSFFFNYVLQCLDL